MAKRTKRNDELSSRPRIRDKLLDTYKDIEKGYSDQRERADDISDYWDVWNCQLSERQFYNGNSRIFLPIAKNAINARKTRFVNQIFPQSGRYVEVTTENEDVPHATMSLLEHYVRACKLRTQVAPALMVNGDVEGQYSVYVGWKETKRTVVTRSKQKVKVGGFEHEMFGEVDTVEEETITDGKPYVEVISDSDLLVLPQTCDSIEDALEEGGSVTVVRRWSKAKLKAMAKDGEITQAACDTAVKEMSRGSSGPRPNTPKDQADAAGIKSEGIKYMLGYETWTKLKVDGDMRLCRAFFGGDEQLMGCKINPYWCDKVPVISAPVQKMSNVFKGRSLVADVIDTQIFANDTINEGADTAHFSAMPIVMTDPEKNPKVGTMILGLASVWETDPKSTQFAKFPELWKDSFAIVAACKAEIFQTLSVNPSMIAQSTGGKAKRNQAEIAAEQQADILQTADAVINVEEGILTPLLQRFAEYDHQFREEAITVRKFGEMGLRANMEDIPPIEANNRFSFRWFGVEAARNAQQIQQQIAMANVIKGVPPQMYQGYRLDMTPLIIQMSENAFGPRLAPLVFVNTTKELSVDPELENAMMVEGFDVHVHPQDDDQQHIQAHMAAMKMAGGDPHGTIRSHIIKHQGSMQQKMQQQMAQQQGGGPKGLPGAPGGAGPGVPGTAPGAQPGQPSNVKGPPGMINPDQMPAAGAVGMPRQ